MMITEKNIVECVKDRQPVGEFTGHRGQPITAAHPDFIEMRSTRELHLLIAGGFETAACWEELKRRAERVRAAREVLERFSRER